MHHYPGIATEGAKDKERRKWERGVRDSGEKERQVSPHHRFASVGEVKLKGDTEAGGVLAPLWVIPRKQGMMEREYSAAIKRM